MIKIVATWAFLAVYSTVKCDETFPILMPNVRPKLPYDESYLCTGIATNPTQELYISGFEPRASMENVHHLMVVGCSNPTLGSQRQNLWNCGGTLGEESLDFGGTCQGGEMQVMFMWSLNGSSIFFPENSGMTVGGSSPIQLIVLQVHYTNNEQIPQSGDASGVLVHYGAKKPDYNVGIFSLHSHGLAKPQGFSNWDSACSLQINEGQPLIPFAFLTHTHSLGVAASGWLIQGSKWSLIGKSNPQEPQSFYPVATEGLEITGKDTLASRCIMKSTRKQMTMQGLSKSMEMCDYFVLYKTKGQLLPDNSCTANSSFTWANYGLTNYAP